MPYAIKTKDGIIVDGIPDDMPKDAQVLKDLVAKLRSTGQKSAQFGTSVPSTTAIEPAQQVVSELPRQAGVIETAARELPQNLGVATRGVVGGLAAPVTMLADPLTELLNLILPDDLKQLPPSQGLQALLTRAGVPDAKTEAQKVMQAATAGLAGGAGDALIGGALKASAGLAPTVLNRVGSAMAAEPLAGMVGGAAGDAASAAAKSLGAPESVQMAAGLAGGALAGNLASTKIAGPSKELIDVVADAKQRGVNLMTSDVRPPKGKFGQAAQQFGELMGTSGVRRTQQQQRVAAVRDLTRQYGAVGLDETTDDVMQALLSKRTADLDKWTKVKDDVIEALSIPEAGRQALPGGRKMIEATTGQVPSKVVPMTATTQKIDDSITFLEQLKTAQVKPVIAVLEDWKQAIQGQDLRNIEFLRRQAGDAFKAPELASVRATGDRVLSDIYGAVKDDMTAYIKATGGEQALNRWQVANKNLSDMMKDLDLTPLKKALNDGTMTPELVRPVLFSQNKSTVEALYKNLNPEGRKTVQAAVLSKAAFDRYGNEVTPDEYLKNVKKLSDQVGVFFSGDDLKAVEGLTRVLDLSQRAGALTKTQGSQMGLKSTILLPYTIGAVMASLGGGVKGFAAAIGAGAAVGGAARLYESKAMRDLLIRLPSVTKGSEQEANMLRAMLAVAQTANLPQESPVIPERRVGAGGAH